MSKVAPKIAINIGDTVQLAKQEGIFVDYETKFEVVNDQIGTLENKIGKATKLAIQSGGLVIVDAKKSKGKEKKDSSASAEVETDLPEDLPGRDAFIAAGMNFEAVKNFDFNINKVQGVGAKTIESLKEYADKFGTVK